MSKFNRNTVDRGLSSVAVRMWSRTLQFSLTLADRSKPATLPPKTHGRQVLNGSLVSQPAYQWQTNEDGGDHQYRHIVEDCPQGTTELFREDSGRSKHTTGTGFAPGFAASGGHGAMELCDPTSWPKKISRAAAFKADCSLLRRWPEIPTKTEQHNNQPCWSPACGSESAERVVVENAVRCGSVEVPRNTIGRHQWRGSSWWRQLLGRHQDPGLRTPARLMCCRWIELDWSGSGAGDALKNTRGLRFWMGWAAAGWLLSTLIPRRRSGTPYGKGLQPQKADKTHRSDGVVCVGNWTKLMTLDQLQQVGDVQQEQDRSKDRPLRNSIHNSWWRRHGRCRLYDTLKSKQTLRPTRGGVWQWSAISRLKTPVLLCGKLSTKPPQLKTPYKQWSQKYAHSEQVIKCTILLKRNAPTTVRLCEMGRSVWTQRTIAWDEVSALRRWRANGLCTAAQV